MRGGYGGSKRLIVRHNRSLCDAMRQCKNSRPLRFCENSLTSGGKLPMFPPIEIPAAQICMRVTALYNCMTAMRSCWTKAVPAVDITARVFADKLSAKWGQPVIVENRPGGDAFIAIMAVIGARDDHILLFAPASTFTAHSLLHEKLPYDIKDLVPIARVTNTLIALGVPTALGAGTIKELAAKIDAAPGKLNYASVTGANDLMWAAFLKTEKLDMAKVPYKDPVTAINDLSEGRIQAFVGAYAIMRPRVLAGKVKVIALTNLQHAAALPAIPTGREAGYKSLEFDGLVGLLGPRNMPLAVRDRIAADIRTIAAEPEVIARLSATGQVVNPGSPTGRIRRRARRSARRRGGG